jgi:hypothetical protein
MGRAFVKKNIGRKFVVALVGHDHGLGEAEFIVRLPSGAVIDGEAAQRRVVLARALELSDEFASGIRSALEASASGCIDRL